MLMPSIKIDGGIRKKALAEELVQMGKVCTEQTDQAYDDEIQCDDKIEQSRHHQDQYSGDQRNQRGQAQLDAHDPPMD
jgi:hypothetical protein